MKSPTTDEMDKLMASIRDRRLRLMVLLAFRHGLRASEVCNLEWKDVDLPNKTITCRRLKGSITNTQALSLPEIAELTAWREFESRKASKYVFPGNRTPAVSRYTFYRQFHAACLAAGLPRDKAHCHVLKHYCAVRLVEANISLPIVQAALGHKSISSTAVYAKPSAEVVDRAMSTVFERK
jgi:type 1 fimbriae regulatory protein FimB